MIWKMGESLTLHAIIPRARFVSHNRLTIDLMSGKQQTTSQVSDRHYHNFMQKENTRIKTFTKSASHDSLENEGTLSEAQTAMLELS